MKIQHLMEDFKFVVIEKYDFENVDVVIDNIFGRSLIEAKKYAQVVNARLATGISQNTMRSCHRHSNETSMIHEFDINRRF